MAGNLAEAVFWAGPPQAEALVEVAGDGAVRRFSFHDLQRRSNAFAAALVAKGVLPGARVALVGDNSVEHFIALLAILKTGGVACLINTKLAAADRQALIDDTGCVLTLTDAPSGGEVTALALSDVLTVPNAAPPDLSLADDALAVIMFTSGSSGRPKGVPISHDGYLWALGQFTGLGGTLSGRTGIVAAPLFHMNGQFHVMNMLSVGARVVLMKTFSARGMVEAIAAHGVKRVTGVPTMAALMAKEIESGHRGDVSTVEQVGLGSSPLSRQLLDRIQAAFPNAIITNGYGTTETGPVSFSAHPQGLPTPPTALGYPMAGVDLKLVGGASPDEGVLHIRNPMTLKGYWNRPDISAERLDREGWYITGDRMRRDEDGFFYFLGRADDMMQVGAENVYPAEVERLLERHPAIAEAVVVAVPHATKNEAPVAFVIAHRPVTEGDLKAFALAEGPAYAHPRRVFFVDELPLASTNKIDRTALTARAVEAVGGSL